MTITLLLTVQVSDEQHIEQLVHSMDARQGVTIVSPTGVKTDVNLVDMERVS